jgi:polyribonucleotide nucleotidyltransferase
MFNIIQKEIVWGGGVLSLETGKVARQADSAVMLRYGDMVILCTLVVSKDVNSEIDFVPLSVSYQERFSAVGKIPGGFFKREGKPNEREVLISRLIDRSVRPLISPYFRHPTQILCEVKSYSHNKQTDVQNASSCDSDILALIGASVVLQMSGISSNIIAAARAGFSKSSEYLLNTSTDTMDLLVAGAKEGVTMIELKSHEVSKNVLMNGINFCMEQMQPVLQFIEDFVKDVNAVRSNCPIAMKKSDLLQLNYAKTHNTLNEIKEYAESLASPLSTLDDIDEFISCRIDYFNEQEFNHAQRSTVAKQFKKDVINEIVVASAVRIDNRQTDEIRQIECELNLLPSVHGSALFTRGDTQVFASTTIGSSEDAQTIDDISGEQREKFMLHYTFPGYSVGEVSKFSGPGRREIGHGRLAWKSLLPLLPTNETFPYVIRVTADVTESNGSSSMATVCSSYLAMRDAGIPLSRPIAGVAMGLMIHGDQYKILTDLSGTEDDLGYMDFKIAATDLGITAIQMDIKIPFLTIEMLNAIVEQSLIATGVIRAKISSCCSEKNNQSFNESKVITKVKLEKDQAREIIGPGGRVIKEICSKTSAKLSIENNELLIFGAKNSREQAVKLVQTILKTAVTK